MRKYEFKIQNTKGETITRYTMADTKKKAIESTKNRTYLIDGEIYEIIKTSFRWVD